MKWPNFLDETGVAKLYKVRAVPTMYLIDAEGRMVGDNLRGEALAENWLIYSIDFEFIMPICSYGNAMDFFRCISVIVLYTASGKLR